MHVQLKLPLRRSLSSHLISLGVKHAGAVHPLTELLLLRV
jgi:hypothetical protein